MGNHIDAGDVIDAQEVAELLGPAHRNTVSSRQRRCPTMARQVIDLGHGRCKLWHRREIEIWQYHRAIPTIRSKGR